MILSCMQFMYQVVSSAFQMLFPGSISPVKKKDLPAYPQAGNKAVSHHSRHGTHVAIIIPLSVSTGVAAKLVKDLETEVASFRPEIFVDNTKRTYTTNRNLYFEFCAELCVPPVPASQETIAMYAAYLVRRLKSSSIRQYLNIVRKYIWRQGWTIS